MICKQLLCIGIALLQMASCQSQDELLRSFELGEFICNAHQFVDNEYLTTFNTETNEIKILDKQLNIMKRLTYRPGHHFNSFLISYISKSVFDTDDKLEFLIQSVDNTGKSTFQIINEENEVLMDQEDRYTFLMNVGKQTYIVVRETEMYTDVFPAKIKNTDKIYKVNGESREIEH